MKRLEKVDKSVNDMSNGNENGGLSETIIRNISKAFYINSIELVDNGPFVYDDLPYGGGNLDDDVFIEKEKEFSCLSAQQPDRNETAFSFEGVERRRLSSSDEVSKNYQG